MSEHGIEPLSSLARTLLRVERDRPDDPPEMSTRVLQALSTSIGAPLSPTAAGSASQAPPPAPPPAATGSAVAGAAAAKAGVASVITAKSVAILASVFVAGGVAGMAVRGPMRATPQTEASSPALSTVPAFTALPAASSVVVTNDPPAPPEPTSSTRTTADPSPAASHPDHAPTRDTDLAAERALIERARMALARGQGDSSLDAVRQHSRDFPHGRLSEEREAIAVQALVQAGRLNEARGRAAFFRASYPSSVFLPAVNAAIGTR